MDTIQVYVHTTYIHSAPLYSVLDNTKVHPGFSRMKVKEKKKKKYSPVQTRNIINPNFSPFFSLLVDLKAFLMSFPSPQTNPLLNLFSFKNPQKKKKEVCIVPWKISICYRI